MTAFTTSLFLLLLVVCLPAKAQRYAVVIHEILADPQPSVGLPDAEFIELRNRSAAPIDLSGWRLQTTTATSGAFPRYLLQPDSLVVVAARTNASLFGSNTLGITSFPALANGGTALVLTDANGMPIHAVAYATGWYGNAVKAEGGWSLEMIDAANPCGGAANWDAARHPAGGTPGKPNSVQANNKDETPLALLSATAPDSLHLLLYFDEPLDSATAANTKFYQLEPALQVASVQPVPPLYQHVQLTLQSKLQVGIIYTLTAAGITDCAGNTIGSRNSIPVGLPHDAAIGDVVINEILFNPKEDGTDYIELFSRGKNIIDLAQLWVSNGSGINTSSTQIRQLATKSRYIFPGQYVVVTEDRDAVLRQYLVRSPDALVETASLPSLPDDKGVISLLNAQGQTVDELSYHHNWHFALLTEKGGVALERIDPAAATQNSANWTSAAATAGFGTPTYQNSQYRQQHLTAAAWDITPQVFSPDGDGFDDFCTIAYQLDAPNYVANLRIFDAGGRPVRHLVQNETMAQNGFWRWDGLNNTNNPLPTGSYILLLELFNLQGKKQQWKKTVVLAKRR